MLNINIKRILLLLSVIAFIILILPDDAIALDLFHVKVPNDKCDSISDIAREWGSNPWWSSPFDIVSSASVGFAKTTFDKVAGSMIKVVGVGLALWLGVFTLKIVGSLTESSPLDNMTKIFGMMFKAGVAVYLLENSKDLFTYFISPIIEFGSGLGGIESSSSSSDSSGLFSAVKSLKSVLMSANDQVSTTHAKGQVLMCASRIYVVPIFGEKELSFPEPGAFGNGCMLWFITWVMSVAWPLLVFDALVRLGITAALSPLFVAAWVFPSTTSYTQKGFNSFLNIAFFYVFLKFVITIGCSILEGTSGVANMSDDLDSKKTLICQTSLFHIDECEGTPPLQSNPIIFLAACFYAFHLLKEATNFANYFSDTSFSNDNAFQAAASTGNVMKKGLGLAKDGIVSGIDKTKQDISRSQVRKYHAFKHGEFKGDYSKLSDKQKKSMLKTERKLKEKGILDMSGKETESYGSLLKLGRRRTFANWITRGRAYSEQRDSYENWRNGNAANKALSSSGGSK